MELDELTAREAEVAKELERYTERALNYKLRVRQVQQAETLLARLKNATPYGQQQEGRSLTQERLTRAMNEYEKVSGSQQRISDRVLVRGRDGEPQAEINVNIAIDKLSREKLDAQYIV